MHRLESSGKTRSFCHRRVHGAVLHSFRRTFLINNVTFYCVRLWRLYSALRRKSNKWTLTKERKQFVYVSFSEPTLHEYRTVSCSRGDVDGFCHAFAASIECLLGSRPIR